MQLSAVERNIERHIDYIKSLGFCHVAIQKKTDFVPSTVNRMKHVISAFNGKLNSVYAEVGKVRLLLLF